MKKMIFLLGITTLMFTACNQPKSSAQLLEDETQRQEIMRAITNDKEMMTEMSDIMMSSESAKMMMMKNKDMMSMMGNPEMMQNNPGMMKGMMGNMMQMAQTDSVLRKNMTGMMANHRPMMQSMMQTMQKKGIMSPECMKANMQNLDKMKMESDSLK